MKFSITTLGCKVNIYESEAVSYDLKMHGWEKVEIDADVQIINTCTVTQTSDSKSRKMIRQLIRENPNAITVVMGCYSELSGNEVASIPGVSIVIGTNERSKIYELIEEYRLVKQVINHTGNALNNKSFEELKLHELSLHTRGFVKVQDGCDNFCTYCAIPYARGPIKSRNADSIIEEIKILVENGVKEVILAGINTGTYGKDLGNYTLAKLIDKILTEVPNLYRLRLSSIELMEVSDELLETIKKYEGRIANHLHIPLQSGCDETLSRMKRKYNMTEYMNRIIDIRQMFPDIAITTDCLAGFVGETEEEFNITYKNMKKIGFAQCHIFPYSRRSGTKADEMEGHLNPTVIKARAKALQLLGKQLAVNYQNKFIGHDMDVLFEQLKNGFWYGHTTNYLEVKLEDKGIDLTNEVVKVTLKKVTNDGILAKEV